MKTKQIVLVVFAAMSFTFGSCSKSGPDNTNTCVPNNTGVPTAAEISSLQNYLTTNNISAIQHSGGFFYRIITQGTGATPTLSSRVTVKYTGTLQSGAIFDQNTTGATFLLSDLILGWQRGLPLIQKGGTIFLYLPPSLAYGCTPVGNIPPGSNIIFSIDLVDVQ